MPNKKNEIENIDFEFGVDSRYLCKKERTIDGRELMKARMERFKNLTAEQIAEAKVMQAKLKSLKNGMR